MNQQGPEVERIYREYGIEEPVEDRLLEDVLGDRYSEYGSVEELIDKEPEEFVNYVMEEISVRNILNPGGPGKATSEELGSILGELTYQRKAGADD